MIELNLLPDVKQDYIKAERARSLVISISFIVTAASVGLLLLLLSVSGLQKKHINDLTADIKKSTKELKAKPQISKILTVQNQLNSISALHDKKPSVAAFFTYLNQVTPESVDINTLTVDFTENSANITGGADNLSSVNKYVDTLKFTTYTIDGKNTPKKAFNNVVMSSFSISGGSKGKNAKPATYTITFNYDPEILDVTKKVTLSVPKLTSTRSTSGSPNELFKVSEGAN